MTTSFEELLKKHTYKIRCLALHLSHGYGGTQQVDELAAVGNVALWQCYRRFDVKRTPEINFWMYAQRRVCGAMVDVLRNQGSVSRYVKALIKTGEIEKTPWAVTHPVSLEAAAAVPSSTDPYQDLVTKCDCALARRLVSTLSPRHQFVSHMYFVENMKLADIGEQLGVSESRVSQIKLEALAFMRMQTKNS